MAAPIVKQRKECCFLGGSKGPVAQEDRAQSGRRYSSTMAYSKKIASNELLNICWSPTVILLCFRCDNVIDCDFADFLAPQVSVTHGTVSKTNRGSDLPPLLAGTTLDPLL